MDKHRDRQNESRGDVSHDAALDAKHGHLAESMAKEYEALAKRDREDPGRLKRDWSNYCKNLTEDLKANNPAAADMLDDFQIAGVDHEGHLKLQGKGELAGSSRVVSEDFKKVYSEKLAEISGDKDPSTWDALGQASRDAQQVHSREEMREELRHAYAQALKDFGVRNSETGQMELQGYAADKWSAYLMQFTKDIDNNPQLAHLTQGGGPEIVHGGNDGRDGKGTSPTIVKGFTPAYGEPVQFAKSED